MKWLIPILALALGVALLVVSWAVANDATTAVAKSHYLVISTHSPEQCLHTLDQFADAGKSLKTFDFGCKAGDHTAYAIVPAASDEDARNTLPAPMRASARVIRLDRFTTDQIRAMRFEAEKEKQTLTGVK
jgi:hypothetical protein